MFAHTLVIDGGSEREVAGLSDLRTLLAEFRRSGGEELALGRDDGSWTMVLVSGDRAFVTLSIEIDRENYFAVDPDFAGADFLIPFRLSNGQVDEVPRSWTVPLADALASVEDFVSTGARSGRLTWRTSG